MVDGVNALKYSFRMIACILQWKLVIITAIWTQKSVIVKEMWNVKSMHGEKKTEFGKVIPGKCCIWSEIFVILRRNVSWDIFIFYLQLSEYLF